MDVNTMPGLVLDESENESDNEGSVNTLQGGDSCFFCKNAGNIEEADPRCGFSLGSSNNGRLLTPQTTEDNYVNVINASLINNSVNSNVCNFVEFNPEVKVKFNPKVKDILRPQEALGKDILRPQGIWEKI